MSTVPCRAVLLLVAALACTDRTHPALVRAHGNPSASETSAAREMPRALERLAAADSSVVWERQSLLVGDVDCDGVPDSVFVGRSASRVAVGVIRAAVRAPEIVSFGVNGGAVQDDVGSNQAQLAFESLDYDPRDEVGAIDGFQRSRVCRGLSLGDGDSDAMHIFWNHKSHHLDWWRA